MKDRLDMHLVNLKTYLFYRFNLIFDNLEKIGDGHYKFFMPYKDKKYNNIEIELKIYEDKIPNLELIYRVKNFSQVKITEKLGFMLYNFEIECDFENGLISKKSTYDVFPYSYFKFLQAVILIANR